MNEAVNKEIRKCLEDTFIRINGQLDGKQYKTIETDEAVALSDEFIKEYDYISPVIDAINNGSILFKHWENTIGLVSLMANKFEEVINLNDAARIDENFTSFANDRIRLCIESLRDLKVFKLYLMALEEVYKLDNSRPVIIKLISREMEIERAFEKYNSLAERINSSIDKQGYKGLYMDKLALIEYNNSVNKETLNNVIELVKDKNFISRPWYYIYITIIRMTKLGLIYPPYKNNL